MRSIEDDGRVAMKDEQGNIGINRTGNIMRSPLCNLILEILSRGRERMTRYCRLCKTEIPAEEAWSDHCKRCKRRINEVLSKNKRLSDFQPSSTVIFPNVKFSGTSVAFPV